MISAILRIIAQLIEYFFNPDKARERRREADIARMEEERRAIADGDSDAASAAHADRMRRVREYKNRRAEGK